MGSLALIAMLGHPLLRAESPPTPTASPRLNQALLSRLPKFDPAKSDAARKAAAEAAARKAAGPRTEAQEVDGIVYLPDYEVTENKVTAPRDDEWISGKELAARAARRLEAKSTTLELLLNRWHIPYLSPSFKARALAEYEAERTAAENARLQHVIDVSNGAKK